MTDKITIRPMRDTDRNFILSTWLKSHRQSEMVRHMSTDDYFKTTYNNIILKIIDASDVLIACLIDDPDVIISYLVQEDNILHYVFTKDPWRRLGIMKMLIKSSPEIKYFTHWTEPVFSLRVKYPDLIFNPFKGRTYDRLQDEVRYAAKANHIP